MREEGTIGEVPSPGGIVGKGVLHTREVSYRGGDVVGSKEPCTPAKEGGGGALA